MFLGRRWSTPGGILGQPFCYRGLAGSWLLAKPSLAHNNLSGDNGPRRGDANDRFNSRLPLILRCLMRTVKPEASPPNFGTRACSLERKSHLLAIQQELSQSQVFHFAGHAISSVKQSGLVLASLTGSGPK